MGSGSSRKTASKSEKNDYSSKEDQQEELEEKEQVYVAEQAREGGGGSKSSGVLTKKGETLNDGLADTDGLHMPSVQAPSEENDEANHISNLSPGSMFVHDRAVNLIKMGSTMLRTKNCSEEFQSIDLQEPLNMGKLFEDETQPLHPLAFERFCLIHSSSLPATPTPGGRASVMLPHNASTKLVKVIDKFALYWLHVNTIDDMQTGAQQLRQEGAEDVTILISCGDPVVFAKSNEDAKNEKELRDTLQHNITKSAFICKRAAIRHATPSRPLLGTGRNTLAEIERDVKMSLIHLVAQDLSSNGLFPAYFGKQENEGSLELGKIAAAHPDNINSSVAATAEGFEILRPKIWRISTSYKQGPIEIEEEINMVSQALLRSTGEMPVNRSAASNSQDQSSSVFEESVSDSKIAIVVMTFADLSPDTGFILLLATIAKTFQQRPIPTSCIKLFEEVSPNGLAQVVRSFLSSSNHICVEFNEFLKNIATRIFSNPLASDYFISLGRTNVVRYAYTFLFSYYCYDTYAAKLSTLTFSKWLKRHYLCYRSLSILLTPVSSVLKTIRRHSSVHLVPECANVEIVTSDFGVKARGFRKILPAPIYGSASPTIEELRAIVENCTTAGRWRHTSVVWCDLRVNPVVYINDIPYNATDKNGHWLACKKLVASGADLEQIEDFLKENLWKSVEPTFIKQEEAKSDEITGEQPVITPREVAAKLSKSAEWPNTELLYFRLPVADEKAPSEQVLQDLVNIIMTQQALFDDEDGPAFLFTGASGVGAVTSMMIAGTLVVYHVAGFPFGCHAGEEERVSLKNVQYTQGNFQIVRELVEQLPRGNQVKREVDAVLDACWDRMTSTFYHLREIIFATFTKAFVNQEEPAADSTSAEAAYANSINYLERYIILIIFNAYLHAKKHEEGGWQANVFQDWLAELAAADNKLTKVLDNLRFQEFGDDEMAVNLNKIRYRWLCRGEDDCGK